MPGHSEGDDWKPPNNVQELGWRLKLHEENDNSRFDVINDFMKEAKWLIRIGVVGILGAVGTAVINLVVHRP